MPELSVNDWIRKGNLKPGELRLKMYRIAICAKVSKEAMHFCISGVTGMFSFLKSSNVNFSLNQIVVPEGNLIIATRLLLDLPLVYAFKT